MLITSHKIGVYRAAHDLFDEIDPCASFLGEVSCISVRDEKTVGFAKDPVTCGMALDTMVDGSFFHRTDGDVLIFSTGGSGTSLLLHLLTRRDDIPNRFIVADKSLERLDEAAERFQPYMDTSDLQFALLRTAREADLVLADTKPFLSS